MKIHTVMLEYMPMTSCNKYICDGTSYMFADEIGDAIQTDSQSHMWRFIVH